MKSKLFMVLFAAFLFSIAFASAASFSANSPSLSQSANSTTLTLTNTNATVGNITVTLPASITISDGTNTVTVSTSSQSVLIPNGSSASVTLTATSISPDLKYGAYSSSLLVKNSADSTDNVTSAVTFSKGFCDFGAKGNSSRSIEVSSVSDESSDDEWEWRPLDEVEIEVEVEFEGEDSDDEADIVVELGLYDSAEDEFLDLGEDDVLESDLSLEDGDDGTVTFNIDVPVDVEDDTSGRYKIMVKAYEDGDEDKLCAETVDGDYFQEVDIEKNNYDVVLKEISSTEDVPCGSEVLVTADVYNIGTNDEDKVYVNIYNKELGLNMNSGTFELDEGDKDTVSFNFMIPANATEKKYTLDLTAYFKYSDSSDTFREHSEDDFSTSVIISGKCVNGSEAKAAITAEYSDETPKAVAGNDVTITATVKNTGSSAATYTITVPSVSWAEVSSIAPKTLTLAAGESGTADITLNLYENATAGEKEFTIRATSGASVLEQKVKLSLEKGFTWSNIVNHFKNNWFIYTIILVNILLLIIIIIAIVRVSKRSD